LLQQQLQVQVLGLEEEEEQVEELARQQRRHWRTR
jgi:hypothetical protein